MSERAARLQNPDTIDDVLSAAAAAATAAIAAAAAAINDTRIK